MAPILTNQKISVAKLLQNSTIGDGSVWYCFEKRYQTEPSPMVLLVMVGEVVED